MTAEQQELIDRLFEEASALPSAKRYGNRYEVACSANFG